MKVVFVSSEMRPFASTGGLGDVGGALPFALMGQGADVMRVMPMYRRVLEGNLPCSDTHIRIQVPVGLRTLKAEIWRADEPGPATYFVRKDEFFDRRELYSLPERDYDDNFERFVFFQKAVVGLLDTLHVQADIVHINDWQTALMPYFLEYGMQGIGREMHEQTVFTIHNLAYQGVFPSSVFPYSSLPYSCFSLEELEFYGNINCLKGAIKRCDQVTTVSERYAKEILTPEFGSGLEGVLAESQHKLTGILNGVDYGEWDPRADILIAASYSADNMDGKLTCKRALLEGTKLRLKKGWEKCPVVGMVSRLVDQKGMDLLANTMEAIMQEDIYFVMLGSGLEMYQELCLSWAQKWPDRYAVQIGYNNALAHQIEAGSDIFMMPSKFEPCGLNQMYSLRYGTLPIVHATGGLDDTITNLDASNNTGNGFKFTEYTGAALLSSLREAIARYRDTDIWYPARRRIMAEDFSWDRSAERYIKLYETTLAQS